MKPKVYLHAAACPKAGVDMEKIAWTLRQAGFELTDEPAGAAIGVVFGCGFIDDAKQESVEDILGLVELKQRLELDHIIVIGCLAQRDGKALALSLPEVDAFVGIGALSLMPMICSRILEGKLQGKVWDEDLTSVGVLADVSDRLVSGGMPWVRTVMICDGCDNACSYCAIPLMRGPLRSRDAEKIAEEVQRLALQGAKEIVLAGQDTASYGDDLGENGLADLLDMLAERFPETWLRLAYANPDNLDERVADVMAAHANVCNYIDIPIQHASRKILEAMGREGADLKLRKIAGLRKAVPDIALRTSVIVGFPGETEEDMDELTAFLGAVEFDLVGVFAYSLQAGTAASRLPGRVPDEVKQARIVDLVSVQNEISRRKMEASLGAEVTVLVDERDDPDSLGHSQYDMASIDRIVRILQREVTRGEFARARLERVSAPFEWTATLVAP